MTRKLATLAAALLLAAVLPACNGDGTPEPAAPDAPDAPPALQADAGVDIEGKVLRIGVLNDESGPAVAIGKPYANGKRILAAMVNQGGSGLLPDGWTVELVERDHGYNPQASVQAFNEIKDDVLFFGHTFGTPNTLPLLEMLAAESIIALPASLSSKMAENAHTPPAGPGYMAEAQRAMDHVVASAADLGAIKAGVVYQQDDYGKDGFDGWKKQAALHGVQIVSEQGIAAGQKDFTAVVTALKDAGAPHILLCTLPSAPGPLLGTAAQLKYMPQWLGVTPSWVDAFFNPEVIPSAVFTNFSWITGLSYWGEAVDGMEAFLAAYEAHGKELGSPDFYTMMSYAQGILGLAAFKVAVERNDATRAGFMAALQSLDSFTADGLLQPLDYTKVPYVTSTKTRVLKPMFDGTRWAPLADYAAPATEAAAAPAAE